MLRYDSLKLVLQYYNLIMDDWKVMTQTDEKIYINNEGYDYLFLEIIIVKK